MNQPTADEANEPRLMTDIDGEEARLLVHIEAIDPTAGDPTGEDAAHEGDPEDGPGLAE
jgi:hypothetical protein